MHFILISKKETFNDEQINRKLLNSPNAPSLIAREALEFEISDFIIHIYPYDQIEDEVFGYSYYKDEDKLLLVNGVINIDDQVRNPDICKFFQQLNDSVRLMGDYQLISIDKHGNGFIKTPSLSIKQLFFYEDENCAVLSTEIKLIVDGILKFREKPFVDHYDPEFVEESVFREWNPRKSPEKTIFKEIKRIYPHDIKYFKDNKIIIERKDSIQVPKWFRESYNENKSALYDEYYRILVNFAETNLIRIKQNVKKISLGLTGGFDSRLSVSILYKLCEKHNIPFECRTGGQHSHPDVVIAKKVAKALNVNHFHGVHRNNLKENTMKLNDYALTFYLAQGDWNSKDFTKFTSRSLNKSQLNLTGSSGYKKTDLYIILRTNRWYARKTLFNKNFFFPLFNTEYDMWFGLLYGEIRKDGYTEFVYEILKRSEPKLLEIPFAGQSLPQLNIEPYLTVSDSKFHEREPFLWDYHYVRDSLKPLLNEYFNKLDAKDKSFLKLVGLNELDYFLNKEITKILNQYHKNQIGLKECLKLLLKERISRKYPKTKAMMKLTKYNRFSLSGGLLQIVMDFASVANYHSFYEIEKDIGLS